MKILISTSSFGTYDPAPIQKLEHRGITVIPNPYKRTLRPEESIELLRGVVGLIAGTEQLTEAVLGCATDLRVISRCGVGIDSIDLRTADRLQIRVMNTPDAPTQAVAELTLGLILSLLRQIPASDIAIRTKKWEKRMGVLLDGKTIGIIGLGRIGKRVSELLAPFRPILLAYDVAPDETFAATHHIHISSLQELLRVSDVVTIHASASQRLLGAAEFALMKNNAVIVNVARGDVLDEEALVTALREKQIGGAACDVFSHEPYSGLLIRYTNTVLTPHIGSYAKESRRAMEMEAVDNLLRAFTDMHLL